MAKRIPVISLFSGAMGLDLGLEHEGFEVVVAVECDVQAVATIRANRPRLHVIDRRIEHVTTREILDAARLKAGGNFLITGGPSCKSFSTAGQRRSFADPNGGLFHHFVRIVHEARPKFFIMENVKGMLSAAVKHRPLHRRGPGNAPLKREEELGSAFRVVMRELQRLDYYVVFDVLNAADYGVPQCRERLLFIGCREGRAVLVPSPTHSENLKAGLKPWTPLKVAIGRLREREPLGARFHAGEVGYMKLIPEGGNWRDLPHKLKKKALGGAYFSWGGRSGFLRRLAWDRPSPALTTLPDSKATMLCHPTALRPLSLKEYARIQQFPVDWKFEGSVASQYRQIGNAVPIGLGAALGRAVTMAWHKRPGCRPLGVAVTHNGDLVRRMTARPVTFLNPPRLRNKGSARTVASWAKTTRRLRWRTDTHVAGKVTRTKAA